MHLDLVLSGFDQGKETREGSRESFDNIWGTVPFASHLQRRDPVKGARGWVRTHQNQASAHFFLNLLSLRLLARRTGVVVVLVPAMWPGLPNRWLYWQRTSRRLAGIVIGTEEQRLSDLVVILLNAVLWLVPRLATKSVQRVP